MPASYFIFKKQLSHARRAVKEPMLYIGLRDDDYFVNIYKPRHCLRGNADIFIKVWPVMH